LSRAEHDHQNYRHHHGVLGNILPLVVCPESAQAEPIEPKLAGAMSTRDCLIHTAVHATVHATSHAVHAAPQAAVDFVASGAVDWPTFRFQGSLSFESI
jgi:hypothetical protein